MCSRTNLVSRQLTHTRHGGQTFDSPIDVDGGTGVAFSNVAYGKQRNFTELHRVPLNDSGWKNCRKISKNLPDNTGPAEAKPMNNADSYALFASGKFITFSNPED